MPQPPPPGFLLQVNTTGESQQSTNTAVTLAPCEQVTLPITLQVAAGVRSPLMLRFPIVPPGSPRLLPVGITASFDPPSVTVPPHGGSLTSSLVLIADAHVSSVTTRVSFQADVTDVEGPPDGHIAGHVVVSVKSVFTFPLTILAPHVSSVSPTSGKVPMFGQSGTHVTIAGVGFGPGTTVAFGDDMPVIASSIDPHGTWLKVTVPPTAASGMLTVAAPAGVAMGPVFAVDNYRNTGGFSTDNNTYQNNVSSSWSFDDATALFGSSQTEDIFNFGFTTVNLFEPIVDLFLSIANKFLDSNGQCFGMSLVSLRLINGQISYGIFPQQGANAEPNGPAGPNVWTLPLTPPLATYVHQQHLAQLCQENINNWIGFHASTTSAAGLRSAIQQAWSTGGAMIAVNPSVGDGHVMVAYEITDIGGGSYDILTYNCNEPFQVSEDTDPGSVGTTDTSSRAFAAEQVVWRLGAPTSPPAGQPVRIRHLSRPSASHTHRTTVVPISIG